MSPVSGDTPAGAAYLALQRQARVLGRNTDEVLQLYVLEGFLARLAASAVRDQFVLKGGVLLAALDARRPTRDVDLAGLDMSNDASSVLQTVREIIAGAPSFDDGIEFDTVAGRLRRLEEACQVIKSLFNEESTNFKGNYYTLNDAPLVPKPKQDTLPLLIGGGGEKVTLRITAQYADEWNVWGNVELLTQKMAILDQHCEKLGRDPAEIQRSAVALLFVTEDAAFAKKMRESTDRPPKIAGTVSELRDVIAGYAEAGVNEFIVPDFTLGPDCNQKKLDTLDLFIEDIASVVR